jgi:integrase
VDFHALRTTFVTTLARAGVHVKTAQVLARHKTIAMTLEIYTRLGLADDLSALAKLPSLATPAKPKKKKA